MAGRIPLTITTLLLLWKYLAPLWTASLNMLYDITHIEFY